MPQTSESSSIAPENTCNQTETRVEMGNDKADHDHDGMDHDEMNAGMSMSEPSVSNLSTNPSIACSTFASTEATLPHSPMDADEIAEEEHEDEFDKRISYRLVSLNRTRVDTFSAFALWVLAAIFMAFTIAYYFKASEPGSWFLWTQSSYTILTIGFLSLASTMLAQALINVSSDRLKWALASREDGVEILCFLALSSATSIKSLWDFCFASLLCVCLGIVLLANVSVNGVLVNLSEPKILTTGGVVLYEPNLSLGNFTTGRDRTWIQQAMILTINNLAGLAMGAATGLKNVTENYKGECTGNMNRSTCSHFYITQPQPNPTSIIATSNGTLSEDWQFMFPLLVTYQNSWMFHAAVNRNPEIEADWDEDYSCRKYRSQDNSSRMELKICAKEIPLENEHTCPSSEPFKEQSRDEKADPKGGRQVLIGLQLMQADITYDLGLGTVENFDHAIELQSLRINSESYLAFFDALLPVDGPHVNDETLESTVMWFCHWACGWTRYGIMNEGFTETLLMPMMVQQYALTGQSQNNVTVVLTRRLYIAQIAPISLFIFVTFSGVTLGCSALALAFAFVTSAPSLKGFPDLEVGARLTHDSFELLHQRFLRAESIEEIFGDDRIISMEVNRIVEEGELEMVE